MSNKNEIDIKNIITRYMPQLMTGIIIALLGLASFVQIGLLTNAIKQATFWLNFSMNFTIMITIFSLWYAEGKATAKREQVYIDSSKIYADKMQSVVKNKQLTDLGEYCEYRAKKDHKEDVNDLIISAGLDVEIYNKKYKHLSLEELATIKKLTPKQINYIKKARTTPIYTVDVSIFTSGKAKKKGFANLHHSETKEQLYRTAIKATTFLLYAVFLAIAVIDAVKGGYLSAITSFFLRLVTITMALNSGQKQGFISIMDNKRTVFTARGAFLDEFLEWVEMGKPQIELDPILDKTVDYNYNVELKAEYNI